MEIYIELTIRHYTKNGKTIPGVAEESIVPVCKLELMVFEKIMPLNFAYCSEPENIWDPRTCKNACYIPFVLL